MRKMLEKRYNVKIEQTKYGYILHVDDRKISFHYVRDIVKYLNQNYADRCK